MPSTPKTDIFENFGEMDKLLEKCNKNIRRNFKILNHPITILKFKAVVKIFLPRKY